MQFLSSLEYLDLSRNLIGEIMPGTFLGMDRLKGLDFSVNVVRKVRSTQKVVSLAPIKLNDELKVAFVIFLD